jgi:hypothetical protein
MQLKVLAQSVGPLVVKNNIAELQLGARLEISGTLSEPHLDGAINVEEGGRITIPLTRIPFETQQGQVRFDGDKKLPDETPTIELLASGVFYDRLDIAHTIMLSIRGKVREPQIDTWSQDGWDRAQVLSAILVGQTPDEIRRIAQGTPSGTASTSGSAGDYLAKTVTGATFGQMLGEPLRQQTGLDTVAIEFGAGSVDLKACKRFGRNVKTCGQGELGFGGSSRIGGSLEFRLSDTLSGVGRIDYLTRGVDTLQDSVTPGRLELKLRLPLGF